MPMKRYDQVDSLKINKAHDANYVEPTLTLDDWPIVEGYDFEQGLDFKKFLSQLYHVGFQSTELAKAIEIVKQMRKDEATIFLGYSSNMVSSGLREVIAYLVKHRLVHVLATTAGGIEEDVIKTLKPFVIGNFHAPGATLRNQGINRTGNTFIPNDRFLLFEKMLNKFLEHIYSLQKRRNRPIGAREFIYLLGREVKNENSILYWASKHEIPVFCPALLDGSIGDLVYFFKQRHKDFLIDITDDNNEVKNIAMNAEKTGVITLGGGVAKHWIVNANLYREGAEYSVYLTTAMEYEGSDSGANQQEAMSWGKLKTDAPYAKVVGDATLTFPLLVAGAFVEQA